MGPGSARAASTLARRESQDAVSEMRRSPPTLDQRLQQRVCAGQVHMRTVPGQRAHCPWRGIRSVVSVLPCFWLGQCGSSRVYKRRRLSTVRSAQTDFVVQIGISLSFDFIDSSFSNSFRFGFISFSSESSVLLALPMRKSFLLCTKKVGERVTRNPEDSIRESQGFLVTERVLAF